jgi:DNA-binding LacI/PurR family transcriptional regulator
MRQDFKGLGEAAMKMLLHELNHDDSTSVENLIPEIIVRESTAPLG